MNTRYFFAELFYQLISFFLSYMAAHFLQHRITNMLKSYIHILTHIRTLTHHPEQICRKMCGISIMQTNPFYPGNFGYTFYEFRKHLLLIQIHTIVSQFLSYYLKLFYSLVYQVTDFIQNFLYRSRYMPPCNNRNSTIRTLPVASLRYFQVCIVFRSSESTLYMKFFVISFTQILQ